jgi:hypothetical protein
MAMARDEGALAAEAEPRAERAAGGAALVDRVAAGDAAVVLGVDAALVMA